MAKSRNERRRIETTKEENLDSGLVYNAQPELANVTEEINDAEVITTTPTVVVPSTLYEEEKTEVKKEESAGKSKYPTAEDMRKKTLSSEKFTDLLIESTFAFMEKCAAEGLTNCIIIFNQDDIHSCSLSIDSTCNHVHGFEPIKKMAKVQAKLCDIMKLNKFFTDLGYNCMATTSNGILNINISWEGTIYATNSNS